MLYPTHLTAVTGPTSSSSSRSSTSYDYSGQDEINKRKNEAGQLTAAKKKMLYDGDVGGSMAAIDRIRTLLASLKDITPVRLASESSESSSSVDGADIQGYHGSSLYDPPVTRGKPRQNAMAGEPRTMNERNGVMA
jgi:hypothetical protein